VWVSPAVVTLVLLIGLNLLNYIDRYILPGEVSLIQGEFGWNDKRIGLLTTGLFIVYMFVAPLTGWLGDRFRRKPLIIAGAVLWSVATLGTAWVHDYTSMFIRHALVGVGEATFGIFAPAVLADFYPERERNQDSVDFLYLRYRWERRWVMWPAGEMGTLVGVACAVLCVRNSGAGDCGALWMAGARAGAGSQRQREAYG
jgi:MFS family permease